MIHIQIKRNVGEAAVVEADRRAEVIRIDADAERGRLTAEGSGRASAIAAVGKAEAEAIQAKSTALTGEGARLQLINTLGAQFAEAIRDGQIAIVPKIALGGEGGNGLGSLIQLASSLLAEKADSDEIRCQALFYVGSGRLADGDERGAADLEQSIAVASGDPHLELRLRACVNAAGSAYRFGRFADADRYVDLGLRLAEQCEFFAGEYKLKLTRAAVRASQGRWDDAIPELRGLLAAPGDPAAMGLQARSLLARLLARRRSGTEAAAVLAPALDVPEARAEIFVAGPVAAAAVELAWLRGDASAAPALAEAALRRAAEVGHRGSRSELLRYLQRAGHDVPAPADALGPWAPALAGRPLESAAAWATLGERYEEAVERTLSGVAAERERGRAALAEMGAIATLSRL